MLLIMSTLRWSQHKRPPPHSWFHFIVKMTHYLSEPLRTFSPQCTPPRDGLCLVPAADESVSVPVLSRSLRVRQVGRSGQGQREPVEGEGADHREASLLSLLVTAGSLAWRRFEAGRCSTLPSTSLCWFRQKQHMGQLEQRLRDSDLHLLGRGASYNDMCMLRLQVSGLANHRRVFLSAEAHSGLLTNVFCLVLTRRPRGRTCS